MRLMTLLTEFLHAIAGALRKPPALEGDFNFIELEHPEFSFTRIPPEEHGVPCVKSMSPLGEIYVCAMPKGPKGIPAFTATTYICTEFEHQGKRGKYCSQPCLEPESGHYEGAVITTKGEEVIEMTPFAAAAHSQIIAMKEFLRDEDFVPTVGENVMRAFEANLKEFIRNAGLCRSDNMRESNAFLRKIWEHVKAFLGEEKLHRVGRQQPYSCETLTKGFEYPGFVTTGGHPWGYFTDIIKLMWYPEYDSRELAEKYFEQLKGRVHAVVGELTPLDIAHVDRDFYGELDYIYYDLLDEITEELHAMSCGELAERGIVWDELCEREKELEKLLEEMNRHAPIPGMEEEYERAKKEYERELEDVRMAISEAIDEYAGNRANNIMNEYLVSTYGELTSKALDDWVARELKQLMDEYCEKRPQTCMQAYMLKRER